MDGGAVRDFLSFLLDSLVPVSCLVCERDLRAFALSLEFHPPVSWPAGAGEFASGDIGFEIGAGVAMRSSVLCPSCWLTLEPAGDPGFLRGVGPGGDRVPVIAPFLTSDPLLAVIRFLKFSGGRSAAPVLGWWMAHALGRALERGRAVGHRRRGAGEDPLLVPVPLHPVRRRERGYNQAALLAEDVGRRLGAAVGRDILERIRETRSQSTLGATERAQNVAEAFRLAREDAVRHRDLVLVDDLVTTGETAHACMEALRDAPLRSLLVLAAGRTRGLL